MSARKEHKSLQLDGRFREAVWDPGSFRKWNCALKPQTCATGSEFH